MRFDGKKGRKAGILRRLGLILLLLYAPAASAISFVGTAIAGSIVLVAWKYQQKQAHTLNWPWKTIEKGPNYPAKAADFGQNFVFGAGTSAYQVEGGCTNSTYTNWKYPHRDPAEGKLEPVGPACDAQNRYKSDIALMAKLGLRAYRFSVERSKVEPEAGKFDQKELDRYADQCRELIKNNIRPVIGFHHYSDPIWFMQDGGFKNERSITGFTQYCLKVFEALQPACQEALAARKNLTTQQWEALKPMYLTFNSPSSYALTGYYKGTRPPGEKKMQTAAEVLKNMLHAHVQVYDAIRTQDPEKTALVGITHNVYQADPIIAFDPIANFTCRMVNDISHNSVISFFTKGIYKVKVLGKIPQWVPYVSTIKTDVEYTNPRAPQSLDFFAINNYSHGVVPTFGGPRPSPTEIKTDNPRYTIYAEGMYRAIADVSQRLAQPLKIPILITENGIATENNKLRDLFSKRYAYAIARAKKAGHNVRGYIMWSWMDNFEWGTYEQKFGLVKVDRDTKDPKTGQPTLERSVKPGSAYYFGLVQEHNKLQAAQDNKQ